VIDNTRQYTRTSRIPALAWRLDARLRETPVDREAFAREVDRRVGEIATERSQPARLLERLAEAAPLLRIAGRLEEARKTTSAAIALAELLEDASAVFLNHLELAQVMHWEGRFEISTPLFDRLIAQGRSVPAFSGFLHDVLHHAATNLFDQERYPEAARFFREAQGLRRKGGLEELLEVSAEALRRTMQRSAERER
jgi:tetratricopeptide (TPR) repeat protein